MLQEFKSKPRTQKLLARLGDAVEYLMDSNKPEQGESYEDWMMRVGAIYKAEQPKKEERKVYTPKALEPRGYFWKNDKQYFEDVVGGGLRISEVINDGDQWHAMG